MPGSKCYLQYHGKSMLAIYGSADKRTNQRAPKLKGLAVKSLAAMKSPASLTKNLAIAARTNSATRKIKSKSDVSFVWRDASDRNNI
jgi:hypothetical protein